MVGILADGLAPATLSTLYLSHECHPMSLPSAAVRENASETAPAAGQPFTLKPILFAYMCGTMAMMAFVAIIGPLSRQLGLAPWQAGVGVTVSGVLWMLLSPLWGRLSDRRGRRAILLVSFSGVCVCCCALAGWLTLAMHVPMAVWQVFAGMVLTRGGIGGFYAAVPTVSQALIADRMPPEQRVAALAALGAVNGVGLVVGPALAGQLTRFGLEAPLFLTAWLPLLALGVLWKYLKPSPVVGPEQGEVPRLLDPRLRRPMAAAFTAMLTVAIGQIVVGFFAIDRLGMSSGEAARTAGLALTSVGVGLVLSQLVVRRIRWHPGLMIRMGMVVAGLGFGAVLLVSDSVMLMGCHFVVAFGLGFVFPSFSAMAANAVQPHEQGAAAGSVGAAQGLGNVLGPLAGTLLYEVSPLLPYVLAAALLLVVAGWVGRRPRPAA
ncbi:MAG: MFS transporter [Lautropia sp.]|nr:MFS transporter [Lautropia sp.]